MKYSQAEIASIQEAVRVTVETAKRLMGEGTDKVEAVETAARIHNINTDLRAIVMVKLNEELAR